MTKGLIKAGLGAVALLTVVPIATLSRYVDRKVSEVTEWVDQRAPDDAVIAEARDEVDALPVADFTVRVGEMKERYERGCEAQRQLREAAARERTAIASGKELLENGREVWFDRAGKAWSREEIRADVAAREEALKRQEATLAQNEEFLRDFASELSRARAQLERMESSREEARHAIAVKATRLLHLRMIESMRSLTSELAVVAPERSGKLAELDRRIESCTAKLDVHAEPIDFSGLVAAAK